MAKNLNLILRARAAMLAQIRAFFAALDVLEVETPTCSIHANTDPAIESFTTNFTGPHYSNGLTLYLHTSPEFPMKRLVAAGSGSIYQICRVYRNGELGQLHHPEFSMLEWYRLDFNYQQLMDEVANLIHAISNQPLQQQRWSYDELFQTYLHFNPHHADIQQLRHCAMQLNIGGAENIVLPNVDAWLDLLFTHAIQPQLPKHGLTFVYDYPATQAASAYVRPGATPVAERFELYLGTMEVANGYRELGDAVEQQQRFTADLITRQQRGLPIVPMDNNLISALQTGLPSCSGVAVGLDRLLMWLNNAQHIDEVLSFPVVLKSIGLTA